MKKLFFVLCVLIPFLSSGQECDWITRVDTRYIGGFDPRDLFPRNKLIIHLVYSFDKDTVRIGLYDGNSEQDSVIYHRVVSEKANSSFLPTEQIEIKHIRRYSYITLRINNSPTLQISIKPSKHYMLVYFSGLEEMPDTENTDIIQPFINVSYRKYCPCYD